MHLVGRKCEATSACISARPHPPTEYFLGALVILWRADVDKNSVLFLSVNAQIQQTRKNVPLKTSWPVRDRSENRLHEQVNTAIHEPRLLLPGFLRKSGDSVISIYLHRSVPARILNADHGNARDCSRMLAMKLPELPVVHLKKGIAVRDEEFRDIRNVFPRCSQCASHS